MPMVKSFVKWAHGDKDPACQSIKLGAPNLVDGQVPRPIWMWVHLLLFFHIFLGAANLVALGKETYWAPKIPWAYLVGSIILAQHTVHDYPCPSFPCNNGRLMRTILSQPKQSDLCRPPHMTTRPAHGPTASDEQTGDATTKLKLLTSSFRGSRVRAWWKWCRALQFSSSKMAAQDNSLGRCPIITRYLALIWISNGLVFRAQSVPKKRVLTPIPFVDGSLILSLQCNIGWQPLHIHALWQHVQRKWRTNMVAINMDKWSTIDVAPMFYLRFHTSKAFGSQNCNYTCRPTRKPISNVNE